MCIPFHIESSILLAVTYKISQGGYQNHRRYAGKHLPRRRSRRCALIAHTGRSAFVELISGRPLCSRCTLHRYHLYRVSTQPDDYLMCLFTSFNWPELIEIVHIWYPVNLAPVLMKNRFSAKKYPISVFFPLIKEVDLRLPERIRP
jgi:hypothetical protein